MTLLLTPETETAIADRVKSGRYSTADEVVREALGLLSERDRAEDERRLEELRAMIAIGTEQIANGQVTDGELVIDRLRKKMTARKNRS
ncbi:MAG: type II toxin-antitoxin system ParD family antitoxin [Hormoscilla sp.]